MKTLIVFSLLIGLCWACGPNVTAVPPVQTTPPWGTPTTAPGRPENGSCNFDSIPCTGVITQETNDDFDWSLNSMSTPSSDTGPSHDHTTGHGNYFYIEASYPRKQGDVSRVSARVFTNYPACMFFHFHMYGSSMGTLRFYLDGALVWQLSGNQGNQWIKATFPIRNAGYHMMQIEGVVGSSFTSDIALDDLGYQEFHYISPDNCMITPSCANPNQQPTAPTTPPWTYPPTTTYPPWTTPHTNPPMKCGSPDIPVGRVIGGTNARPGSWPWQVGLTVYGHFVCGGSLINENWVVTAAHCIMSGYPYTVVLGDYNRTNGYEGTEQRIRASKLISHPNWNSSFIESDIALIKLSRKAHFNTYVKPVCLPQQDEYVPRGKRCYITGWGKIKHPGNTHDILQQAALPVLSNYECQQHLDSGNSSASGILDITDNMICGGEKGSIKSGCHGDSGGPYVCQSAGNQWVLQGAVSWGSGRCDTSEAYSVFARVAKFRNWIDRTVRYN